jgi:hypothetical protein
MRSSLDEYDFRSLKTKHDKRTAPRSKLLFRREDYRNRDHNSENRSWVRVPVKVISIAMKLGTIEQGQDQTVCFDEEIVGKKGITPVKCPLF